MLEKTGSEGQKKPADKARKREKFIELAESRTRNAIRAIRVVGKLGNKNAYQYDDVDVQKIARALTKEIEMMRARMSQSGGREAVEFKL